MKVYIQDFELKTHGGKTTYIDVTSLVQKSLEDSMVRNGTVTVLTPHTTCSIFYEEYTHDLNENGDEFLQEDLNNVLDKIIPKHVDETSYFYPGEEHYKAVESWDNASDYLPDGDRKALWNGDAHLKATIIGSSEVLAIENGLLYTGKTGYIYFVDFDETRDRIRKCKVVIMGQ